MEDILFRDHLTSLSRGSAYRTSIHNLQKSLSTDYLIGTSKAEKFIPFFKERDGLNKLISVNHYQNTEKVRQVYSAAGSFVSPKLRLLQKTKPLYPTVGTYEIKSSWIKKTFSVKNAKNTKVFEEGPLMNARQTTSNEANKPNRVKRERYKLENAIDKKAKRIDVQRKLGIWECLKIHGSPEEIKEELKFGEQKATIKKFQSEIKTLLNELKR